jgi:uncharacterized protein
MAEPFDLLMQVQDRDTVLDQLRHRRAALPERAALADLGDRRSGLDRSMAEVRSQVEELAGRQRHLEEQIAATAKRRHEIEQRMQSGTITASRDLQAMDHEVVQLAERQSHLEDDELVLVEAQDPLDARLDEARQALDALEGEAVRLQAAVDEAETEIDAAIAVEIEARDKLFPELPPELAERYEILRAHLGGVGAARLVGNRCDGCHLTLPSVEVERIRRLPPDEFATCPQCDRILVH